MLPLCFPLIPFDTERIEGLCRPSWPHGQLQQALLPCKRKRYSKRLKEVDSVILKMLLTPSSPAKSIHLVKMPAVYIEEINCGFGLTHTSHICKPHCHTIISRSIISHNSLNSHRILTNFYMLTSCKAVLAGVEQHSFTMTLLYSNNNL